MTAVLPPLFLQVALTLLITLLLAGFRIVPSLADKEMAKAAKAGRKDVFLPRAKLFSDNLQNQFELPVLFYVAVLLAILTGPVSDGFVTLAWVFAISRVVHALIHVTVNIVMLRLLAFVIGFVVLALMWLSLYNSLLG
jgi:hypothetical protein